MNIVAIIQARMTSSRLPGKILMEVNGKSLLEINLGRISKSKQIDSLILATTDLTTDDKTEALARQLGINVYRGSENDVLDRFYQALQGLKQKPKYVVRLTADCPLIDATLIDKIIRYTIENQLDYCSNTLLPTYPDGQDAEVFKYECLEKAWQEATLSSEREHVTPYIWKNSTFKGGSLFLSKNYSDNNANYSAIRMTVDEPADFDVISRIIKHLGTDKSWVEYTEYLLQNEAIKALNETIARNQGYEKSIKQDA